MESFSYYNPAKVVFGQDSEKQITSLLKEFKASSLLLVYSGDFVKTLGIYDTVKEACIKAKIAFYECDKVVPNPKVELVRELITLGKSKDIDFVLAVGGGSSIDTAKAIALGIPYGGDVWDFFEAKATPDKVLSIGVISTIPASGSETSNATIISNGLNKRGYENNLLIPKFAIMNPRFTKTLPLYQTSCGISDILSHLLERYFTMTKHVDTTDYLIEGAIQAVILNGKRLMKNPEDIDARAEMMWLASIAHNNLLNTGRKDDWASHRIEHELSAQYGITHGEGMAIVMLAYIRYMAKIAPRKLAQLASRVFKIDYINYSQEEMVLELARILETFYKELNLKTKLKELDIKNKDFELMANRATNNDTETIGHYVLLHKKEIIEILNIAI